MKVVGLLFLFLVSANAFSGGGVLPLTTRPNSIRKGGGFTTTSRAAKADYELLDGEGKMNFQQDLDSPKVVTMDSVEKGKKVYCRCWRSGTFPLCDGAHMKHNEATGDNVGPLIVSVAKVEEAQPAAPEDDKMAKKVKGRTQRVILGYQATAVAYLVLAIRALLLNGGVVKPSAVYIGSGHFLAAGLAYILSGAASHDRLSSDTYKRLNLGLMEYSCVGLTLVAVASRLREPLFIIPPLLGAINTFKGYSYGVLGWDKKKPIGKLITDFVDGTKSTLSKMLPSFQNIQAAGYWAATLLTVSMTLAKVKGVFKAVLQSQWTVTSDVLVGLARYGRLFLITSVLYTLKDAAERKRLEGTTFIQLNFLSALVLASMANYLYNGQQKVMLAGAAGIFGAFSALGGITSILNKKSNK